MINSEKMQDRRIEVADVDRFIDDVVAKVIGRSVNGAAFDPGSSHPDAEAARVVIASVVCLGEATLTVDRSSKFTAPDDESVIEHAAHFEILDESPTRLIDVTALQREVTGEIAVLIPSTMKDLAEAHATLRHAAGEETVVGEGARRRHIRTIHVENVFWFGRKIRQVGDGSLHPERHLILRDAGMSLRIADLIVVLFIELTQAVKHAPADVTIDAFRIGKIEDRIALRTQRHALVL